MLCRKFSGTAAWAICLIALRTALAQQCRKDPNATSSACGLPLELANFQGYYNCSSAVLVGRPVNLTQLQNLVTNFKHVKGVGVGHSWWQEQFCSGRDADSVNIVMTELDDTLSLINQPSYNTVAPPNFPIQVNETSGTVTVQAGVPQHMLLDYLSKYSTITQPSGWTLAAFSWFIDQTIGGAVATGTHGSTLTHGSLSSQVTELEVVLANGTLATFTPMSNPHLWKALQISVGRLGIITQLTFTIVPQRAVERSLAQITLAQFADQVTAAQNAYNQGSATNNLTLVEQALNSLDETQAFWFVETDQVWRTDYTRLDREPAAVLINIDPTPTVQKFDGTTVPGAFDQILKAPLAPNPAIVGDARFWSNFYATTARSLVAPGTYAARDAYLSVSDLGSRQMSTFDPYDQYELSVPLSQAGDCLKLVVQAAAAPALGAAFRVPALIRFVNREDAYLSNAHGEPRMFVNVEDHLSRQTGVDNVPFLGLVQLLRQQCAARMHWGKAGWPRFAPCFDGAAEYPDSWCHFGCAVQELDPTGKFASESSVWRWRATKNGTDVPLQQCCSPSGFRQECVCAARIECS
ncbi:hypothetical protein WJX72_001448 [[Myrmecia] bisecta]|uniref:FAD-binding PCMH-type domain-containing protein n=1 Tax=[Myrmecia] bisecta TaxID=41462 RepID=A0AAW1QPT5_9CHLO